MTLPWPMALAAPLPALPSTTISAPALSQPMSSEAGPSMTIFVPGKPMEPVRWPDEPVMRTEMGSVLEIQSRPPRPCWPMASMTRSRAPWVTARWTRSLQDAGLDPVAVFHAVYRDGFVCHCVLAFRVKFCDPGPTPRT